MGLYRIDFDRVWDIGQICRWNMDITKVEAELRVYASQGTHISQIVKPHLKLFDKLQGPSHGKQKRITTQTSDEIHCHSDSVSDSI